AAGITENLYHQVAGAVDDLGLVGKVWRGSDKTAQANDTLHAIQITIASHLQLGDNVDRTISGAELGFCSRALATGLTGMARLAIFKRQFTRHENKIAAADEAYIVRHRRRRHRQGNAQFLKPRLDLTSHSALLFLDF